MYFQIHFHYLFQRRPFTRSIASTMHISFDYKFLLNKQRLNPNIINSFVEKLQFLIKIYAKNLSKLRMDKKSNFYDPIHLIFILLIIQSI